MGESSLKDNEVLWDTLFNFPAMNFLFDLVSDVTLAFCRLRLGNDDKRNQFMTNKKSICS